jgi:hypothetical protein
MNAGYLIDTHLAGTHLAGTPVNLCPVVTKSAF